MRDRFVHWTCNWLLRHIATKEYSAKITLVYRLGMREMRKQPSERGR